MILTPIVIADVSLSPSPTASPTPVQCVGNQEAGVATEVTPAFPAAARDMRMGPFVVLVAVTVGPDGKLLDEMILQSSHLIQDDQAALVAARKSTYTPKCVNGQPVQGSYIFRAIFNP